MSQNFAYDDWRAGFDVSEEAEKPEFSMTSKGKHLAVIDGTEPIMSSQKGTPGLRVRFRCIENNDSGVPVGVSSFSHTMWLTPNAYKFGIVPLCRAVNYMPDQGGFSEDDLVGQMLEVDVIHVENRGTNGDNGEEKRHHAEVNVMDNTKHHGMRPVTDEQKQAILNILAQFKDGGDGEIPF